MSLLSIDEIMEKIKEEEEERKINWEEEDLSDELTQEDIDSILCNENFNSDLFTLAIILLLAYKDKPEEFEEFYQYFLDS